MKERIFRSIVIISFLTCLISSVLFSTVYYSNTESRLRAELHSDFNYIKIAYETDQLDFLHKIEALEDKTQLKGEDLESNRITLIDTDGTVIFDNKADVAKMENHKDRPEFIEAITHGSGEGSRTSATLYSNTLYYAEKLPDGRVLRISDNIDSFLYTFLLIVPQVLAVMFVIVIVILVFSKVVTAKIVAPFNHLSLLTNDEMPYKEMRPFLNKIKEQNKLINAQINTLQRHETEFKIIFENMTEGLMLIDNSGIIKVRSLICDRFLRLLGLIDDKDALNLELDHPAVRALHETLKKGVNTSVIVEKNEKYFNFLINPIIISGAATDGAIVVIIDVTEAASREHLRREFSANVSHELKTPLTSISGFAEIIRNGIAKPEDIKHFADNIYAESQRLLTLIADIIHLSTLDENSNMQFETKDVDIYEETKNIMYYLKNAQEQKYVKVEYENVQSPLVINCVPRIIEEVLYNLCDNAIKYNRLGGKIFFNMYKKDNDNIVWQIRDTGIGIPYESHDRVFERFFRVDKSHSRAIGGTGLGLSIVKHGIAIHGGTVELDSKEGQGSTFTVTLPIKMSRAKSDKQEELTTKKTAEQTAEQPAEEENN